MYLLFPVNYVPPCNSFSFISTFGHWRICILYVIEFSSRKKVYRRILSINFILHQDFDPKKKKKTLHIGFVFEFRELKRTLSAECSKFQDDTFGISRVSTVSSKKVSFLEETCKRQKKNVVQFFRGAFCGTYNVLNLDIAFFEYQYLTANWNANWNKHLVKLCEIIFSKMCRKNVKLESKDQRKLGKSFILKKIFSTWRILAKNTQFGCDDLQKKKTFLDLGLHLYILYMKKMKSFRAVWNATGNYGY